MYTDSLNDRHQLEQAQIKAKEMLKELQDTGLIPIFEIAVQDTETGEADYIVFNITIDTDTVKMIASHEPLTIAERESDKIAFKAIDIDTDFSLDSNLQELYEECITAIIESEFYTLSEE